MKILSDEEIEEITGVTSFPTGTAQARLVLKAQHKDTLRQIRELLDGIENPHQRSIDEEGLPEDVWSQRIARSNISIWDEAIQTIKALLETDANT